MSLQERLDWLQRSISTHPTYRAHYEAGKLHREAGDYDRAMESFEAAFGLTDQDRYLARAAYQIGRTHDRAGRHVEARSWLRRSLGYYDHDEVRRALRDLELSRKGQIATAAEILDEFEVGRSFGVAKAELRVNFELNQATLDDLGYRQAVELGNALSDPRWSRRDEIFVLLGHTDRLCPRSSPGGPGCDRHNLELSRRRAAALEDLLLRRFGLPADRVRAVGCGRQHLLSHQISEDDHYLNRRVVVMALDPLRADRDQLCGYDAGLL